MSRYRFLATERDQYPVRRLCSVLGVSCADYYQWRGRAQPMPAPWQVAA